MIDSTDFTIKQFIARGVNSVYEAVHNQTGVVKCIKCIQITDEKSKENFHKEVSFLEKVRTYPHNNILFYDSHFFEQSQAVSGATYTMGQIVMEKGITNLAYYLQKRLEEKREFDSSEVQQFMTSMVSAHAHLQRIGIAHRDIKPQNIILFDEKELLFKICDFGFAKESREQTITNTVGGTKPYLSPELYNAFLKQEPTGHYNPWKSDVFSLGLVFLEFGNLQKLTIDKRDKLYTQEDNLKNYLQDQRKQMKKRYKLSGMSKVLKQMLIIDYVTRMDFISLEQYIQENEYLEAKSVFYSLNKPAKVNQNLWPAFGKQKSLLFEVEDEHNLSFDFRNLRKEPEAIKEMLEQLAKQLKDYKIRSLTLILELNYLNPRQIGPVAKIINRAHNLEELDLQFWNNKLGNLGLLLLAQPMSKLKCVKKLNFSISNNILTEKGVNQALAMWSFGHLEILNLDFGMNQLPIECCESFFLLIQKSPQLKRLSLNLESNQLNLVISTLLFQTVQKLPLLTEMEINFANNPLHEQGLFEIGDCMAQLEKCHLTLWSCKLNDKGVIEFSKGLAACKKLRSFEFTAWTNEITEKSCEDFGNALPVQLENLNISLGSNKLGDGGVRLIAKGIQRLTKLKELKFLMEKVSLTSFGLRCVSRFITDLKSLSVLNMNFSGNQINQDGMELLFVAFQTAPQLRDLAITLDHNPLGDGGVKVLMKGVALIKNLEKLHLNLESVKGTGQSVLEFLDKIAYWKHIQKYHVNYQKNDTDEGDQVNCEIRLKQLKSPANIKIEFKRKNQMSEDEQQYKMPKRADFRMHAHVNPLNETLFPYPLNVTYVDWSLHYPKKFGKDPLKLALNTLEYPLAYAEPVQQELTVSTVDFLDIGCGFGGLCFALSEHYPEKYTLGMEIRGKLVNFVGEKIRALRIQDKCQNVSVLRTNAMRHLPQYFRKASIEKIFICFPDPHFKKKNFRRRIVNEGLLSEYAFLLKPKGRIYCITDVEDLHKWHVEHLLKHKMFRQVDEDDASKLIWNSTEEGQKVERNKGQKFIIVCERI